MKFAIIKRCRTASSLIARREQRIVQELRIYFPDFDLISPTLLSSATFISDPVVAEHVDYFFFIDVT